MNDQNVPFLSVVICTYNRANFLRDCVQSFIDQSFSKSNYEVIVSDDGSTDNTSDVMKLLQSNAAGSPAIQYVKNIHAGVNATRNSGLKKVRGSRILFFDDDQLAPLDFLEKIAKSFEENPDVDGLGGPVHDKGGSDLRTCSRCSLASASLPNPLKHYSQKLLGGNMTLRRELFDQVGLFDEEISGRGDETEWYYRANKYNLRFLYLPDVWAWHRRDSFTLWTLCKLAFRKGRAIPIYKRKAGKQYVPRPQKILRHLAHAFLRRCTKGAALAFRELGALTTYIKLKFT